MGLYKELLEPYHSRHFLEEDGSLNLQTVVDYTTEILLKHGLKRINEIQKIAEIYIYPQEYFCPINYDTGKISITPNTCSIHHYIAVNDCYDSAAYLGKAPGIELALENLVNSLYSRDLSVKMKSALRTKWSQGYSTAARAPFGYQRRASQNPAWRIDPESAACVRMIFDQALQGHSTSQIAELLNEKKLPTPGAYRERQGQWGGRRKVPDTEQLWNTAMVWKILTRYEYTGAYVMGRRQKLAAGSTATRKTPEAELIIVIRPL